MTFSPGSRVPQYDWGGAVREFDWNAIVLNTSEGERGNLDSINVLPEVVQMFKSVRKKDVTLGKCCWQDRP